MPYYAILGGSSHLVSGLVHPSYKWINPTTIPLTKWDDMPKSYADTSIAIIQKIIPLATVTHRHVLPIEPSELNSSLQIGY